MPEIYHIIPPPVRSMGLLFAVLLIPLLVAGVLAYLTVSSRTATFEVSEEGLRIDGHLYGRRIPAASLLADEGRVVDLDAAGELRPSRRTNGLGLPGYQAGWFRLKNRQKALLFVTERSRVVYVPTTEGYAVMMSVAEPEAFLAALRRLHGRGGRTP